MPVARLPTFRQKDFSPKPSAASMAYGLSGAKGQGPTKRRRNNAPVVWPNRYHMGLKLSFCDERVNSRWQPAAKHHDVPGRFDKRTGHSGGPPHGRVGRAVMDCCNPGVCLALKSSVKAK